MFLRSQETMADEIGSAFDQIDVVDVHDPGALSFVNIFNNKYLNINSSKAFKKLKWKSRLPISKSVLLTTNWYNGFKKRENLLDLTIEQIKSYIK